MVSSASNPAKKLQRKLVLIEWTREYPFANVGAQIYSFFVTNAMIELEVYAAGIRNLEKILELDHEFEAVPGLRYKIDSNHDIVYLDFEEPTMTVQEVRAVFRKLGLEPRIVGQVPTELNPKGKTQPIRIAG